MSRIQKPGYRDERTPIEPEKKPPLDSKDERYGPSSFGRFFNSEIITSISYRDTHHGFEIDRANTIFGFTEKYGKYNQAGLILPVLISESVIIDRVKKKLVSNGFSEASALEVTNAIPEWLKIAPASLRHQVETDVKWDTALVDMIALPAIQGMVADRMFGSTKKSSEQKIAPVFEKASLSNLGRFSDNRREYATAEAFLRAAYDGRLGQNGDLDQASLRRTDPSLMAQLDIEFRGPKKRAQLRKILPTASDRNDQRLLQALGHIPVGQDRQVALNALNRGYQPKRKR